MVKADKDDNTREKILEAARKVMIRKGHAGDRDEQRTMPRPDQTLERNRELDVRQRAGNAARLPA